MGNMGSALMEAEEHRQQMVERDLGAGHKMGCLISVSPEFGGGYCNCGKYERGVNSFDPVRPVGDPISKPHPALHVCRKCATFIKLATFFIAADVAGEFITFVPIHRFFEWMGWIA